MTNDKDVTSAVLLDHMQAMEKRLSKDSTKGFAAVNSKLSKLQSELAEFKSEFSEFRKDNKHDHEVIIEDLEAIGEDIYKQKHETTPHTETRLSRLEDHVGLAPLPVPVAVE